MRSIPASKGYSILVSDEDYERLSKFSWYAHMGGGRVKAKPEYRPARRDAKPPRKVHFLAQAINGPAPAGMVIDHINGDPWDNRRENLRVCTHTENKRNQRRPRKATGAGKGVHLISGQWTACICAGNGNQRIGSYPTVREAELAYDAAALFHHGEFARLNHPEARTAGRSIEQLRTENEARRAAPSLAALALLKFGIASKQVSRRTGLCHSTVCKIAKSHGLSRPRGRPRKAPATTGRSAAA